MPISGTTTDYTDRLMDINISGKLNPLSTATQAVTYSFGKPSQFVAGVQKLIQRYLISLMNSGFAEQLIGCSSNNITIAQSIFAANNWTVIKAFRTYQTNNPGLPLDEQLNTVQLVHVVSNGDTVTFSLQLSTLAGDTVTFVLPLPL